MTTPINRMGEVYAESAWRKAVGVCIQPTCHTDGITPTGEQCRRAFISRERFDEHIAPLLHDLAKAQADLTAAERKGMLRAAEICEAQRKCHPDDDYYDCQEQCENAIRAEANK